MLLGYHPLSVCFWSRLILFIFTISKIQVMPATDFNLQVNDSHLYIVTKMHPPASSFTKKADDKLNN